MAFTIRKRILPNFYAIHSVRTIVTFIFVGWLAACSPHSYTLAPNPTPYVRDLPTEYYLYLPLDYSTERDWPVFVGVHGFGQNGTQCLNLWKEYADKEGFILVCPSLSDESGGWDQEQGERVLRQVIQQVQAECRAQKRAFLAGFSAGAQFVQGYAFVYPKSVTAVAVLSAGNYYPPNPEANNIPFLIVIGDQDNPISVKGASQFTDLLKQYTFSVDLHILPGVVHKIAPETKELTIEFYRQVYEHNE